MASNPLCSLYPRDLEGVAKGEGASLNRVRAPVTNEGGMMNSAHSQRGYTGSRAIRRERVKIRASK